jgi:hypothetical protein
MPKVKERALYYIESGKDIENWEEGGAEPQDIKKRRAVLSKLKGELMSEPLPRRKVPKPSSYEKPRWEVGDIVSSKLRNYDMPEDYYYNRYVLYRVIALEKTPLSHLKPDLASSVWPTAILFDWMGDAVPDAAVIDSLGYHAWANTHRYILYRKEIYTDPFTLSWIPKRQKLELVRHDPDFTLPKDVLLPPGWREWLDEEPAQRKCSTSLDGDNEFAILGRDQAHFEAIYEKYKVRDNKTS